MTLMSGMRNLITRRKSAELEIDIADTPDRAAGEAPELEQEHPPKPAPATQHIETKVFPAESERELRAARKRIDEVGTQIQALERHIDEHAGETRGIVQQLEGLPEALETLATINDKSERTLELLGEHLDKAAQRDQNVDAVMGRITDASADENRTIELMGRKLDATVAKVDGIAEGMQAIGGEVATIHGNITKIGDYITKVGNTCLQLQKAVTDLDGAGVDREKRLMETAARWQRGQKLFAIGCGAVSVVAIAIAVFALMM